MANLEFRYGVMGAGKSMALLQIAYNYEKNNKNILLIKSSVDTKGDNYVTSRIGPKKKVDIMLNYNESLFDDKYKDRYNNLDAILVDEAQFLNKKQVEDLWAISKKNNINVICFGLKTNYKSELFEGSKRLIELADKFSKLETICSCGIKARFNARKVNGKYVMNGKEIIIDGKNKVEYEPLCGKCYYEKVISGK